MALGLPVIQGIYTVLPIGSNITGTVNITRDQIINPPDSAGHQAGPNPEATGIIAYLNITTASGNVTIALQEYDQTSQTWNTVTVTLAQSATGMIKLKLKPAITPVAASATGVVVQDILPANWRLQIVCSSGTAIGSLGVVVYN